MDTISEQDALRGKPAVTIFVNTREFAWREKEISYEQVYALAFPNDPLNDGDVVRIEYSRGHNGGGAGALQPGKTVRVKKGMVFDVYVTVRS
ncbi:multiubiquitin domain-containing protein [Microbacterium sp. WHRI 7836]|uniref:multiubiquitin domain-containing protein n=1 Tax=Microbacterium sp. WHRI 7836 TaxID=3162563 RepID=UPI0032EFC5F7